MSFASSRMLSLLPLAAGAITVVFVLLPGLKTGTSAFTGILTVELLLPLVGIAVILGQLPRRALPLALIVLFAAAAAGLVFRETIYRLVAPVPNAAAHLFLAGPVAGLAIGAGLVLPPGTRRWIVLPLLALAGAALAIATRLSDPALFAPAYFEAALGLQALILLAIAWPVASFAHPVLHTASRILGSWMIAVALLYGGAFVAARETSLTPPPFPPLPALEDMNGKAP